jgi:hypothetical protein
VRASLYPPRAAHLLSFIPLYRKIRSSVAIIVLVYGATIYTSNKNCSLARSLGTACKDVCAERGTTVWKWIDAQCDNNEREGAIIWTLEIPWNICIWPLTQISFRQWWFLAGSVMEVFASVVVISKPLVALRFPKKAAEFNFKFIFAAPPEKPLSKSQQKDEKCGN